MANNRPAVAPHGAIGCDQIFIQVRQDGLSRAEMEKNSTAAEKGLEVRTRQASSDEFGNLGRRPSFSTWPLNEWLKR
jgi:hypothetical protein